MTITNSFQTFSTNIFLFKVNKRNTRKKCAICSQLIIKTTKQCHWCRSGIFIVNCEHYSYLFHLLSQLFLLLILNREIFAGSIVVTRNSILYVVGILDLPLQVLQVVVLLWTKCLKIPMNKFIFSLVPGLYLQFYQNRNSLAGGYFSKILVTDREQLSFRTVILRTPLNGC